MTQRTTFKNTAPALRGGASLSTAPALRGGASLSTAPALRGGASLSTAPALRGGASLSTAPALRGGASLIGCLLLAAGACASDTGNRGDSGQAPGAKCAPAQLTQSCMCSGAARGRQTCSSGAWSSCECKAAPNGGAGASAGGNNVGFVDGDPGANRSAVRFDWQRTTPTGGSCEAGHYEGTFTGIYDPSIIVVPELMVIPVVSVDLPGMPGLAFDLTREGSGEIFTVSNGKLNGNALAAFPISADIVGKLDCDTLKFDAMLVNGSYFIGPLEYHFEGPIVADYDKLTHTLVNGTWVVEEPENPGFGGSGDWTVQWIHN